MFLYIFFTFSVLLFTLLFLLIKRRPICAGKKAGKIRPPIEQVIEIPDLVKYELKDLSTPILVGKPLKYAIRFAYSTLGHYTLVNSIISKSNLNLMQGEYIPEPPSFTPLQHILPSSEKHDAEINNKILNDIISSSTGRFSYRHTSVDYYQAYKSGQCTPLDIATKVLKAIVSSNQRTPPSRAVVMTNEEYTLKLAQASTERWKAGKPLSLIDGVPIAFKAEVKWDPFPFNPGTSFKSICSNSVRDNAVMIKKLVDAGAIVVGQTNMQEYGTGVLGSNPSKEFGTPRNPYDDQCYCGGSSSGSAAAVSAGLCPIAIGADGGGSIRIPASLCGVTGLKPTYRLLDSTGFMPQSFTVCAGGPLCSSVIDVAITMSILSPEGIDLEGFGREDLKGIKIGIYKTYFEHADSEVVTICRRALDIMSSLGAEIKDIVIPELEEARVAHLTTIASEMTNGIAVELDRNYDEVAPETLLVISAGQKFPAFAYINAQKQRTRSIRSLEAIFKDVDIIATPMSGKVAPVIPPGADECGYGNGGLAAKLMRFAPLANLTGIPGISVPVGQTTKEALPVGLQLLGPWYSEGELMTVAYALEKKVANLMTKPTSIYYDVLA